MTGFTPKVNFDILLIFSSLGLSENEKKIRIASGIKFQVCQKPYQVYVICVLRLKIVHLFSAGRDRCPWPFDGPIGLHSR